MYNNHFKNKKMEIKISAQQTLKVLNAIAWIIFIGLCIEAGGLIVAVIGRLVFNPDNTQYFWKEVDLSNLYNFDSGYFFVELLLMNIVAIQKALLFYLIIKLVHYKKFNINQPFSQEVRRFLLSVSYLALGISLFSVWGVNYTEWLRNKGITMPNIESLNLGGADVWLFMSVILFVISQIFKRGIEIQEENDLTV